VGGSENSQNNNLYFIVQGSRITFWNTSLLGKFM
jgi:hypothetical protein